MWRSLRTLRPGSSWVSSVLLTPCRSVTDIEYYREVDQSHLHLWEAQSTRRKFLLKLNALNGSQSHSSASSCLFEDSLLHDDYDNDSVVRSTYVEREATTMLRILASLVKRDVTAPRYIFHDDPYLMPYNASQRKSFVMAKDGGKRTARYILDRHPELFSENLIEAQPRIKAFMPKAVLTEGQKVSEELLVNFIEGFNVVDAVQVFEKLSDQGTKIGHETLVNLLQLICYYGDKGEIADNHLTTLGFKPVEREKWPEVADLVYGQLEKDSSEARLALLCGLARFNEKTRGEEMLKICIDHKDQFGIEAFNARIKLIDEKKFESPDALWSHIESILKEMSERQVMPNVDTLMSVLWVLKERHWFNVREKRPSEHVLKSYTANAISEFKRLNIEFGLGVFAYICPLVDRSDCHKMIREIERRDWTPVKHVGDFDFFPTLMKKADISNSLELAYSIHELYLTANNSLLLAHAQQTQGYFNALFKLMLKKEKMSTTMSFYTDFVPHVWTPGQREYEALLNEIVSQGSYEYLPKLWSDLQISYFESVRKDQSISLMMSFLSVLEQEEDLNLGKRDERLQIAKEITSFLTHNNRRMEELIKLPGSVFIINSALNLALEAYLMDERDDALQLAIQLLDLCDENVDNLLGALTEKSCGRLLTALCKGGEKKAAIKCVSYASNVMLDNTVTMAEELSEYFDLNETDMGILDNLLVHDNRWKPLLTTDPGARTATDHSNTSTY